MEPGYTYVGEYDKGAFLSGEYKSRSALKILFPEDIGILEMIAEG